MKNQCGPAPHILVSIFSRLNMAIFRYIFLSRLNEAISSRRTFNASSRRFHRAKVSESNLENAPRYSQEVLRSEQMI